MARGKKGNKNHNGANLGFEQTLWPAADKLRGNMDAAGYKHVVRGLIFLKYISDTFQARFSRLKTEPHADPTTTGGRQHYFIDQSRVIKMHFRRPAKADSSLIAE